MNMQHSRSQSSASLLSMDATLAESSRSVVSQYPRSTSSASLVSFDCTVGEPGSRVPGSFHDSSSSSQQLASSPKALHRRLSSSNTVVQAMLSSNTLRSCSQAGDMVSQCMFSSSDRNDSALCKTAHQYLNGCMK